MAKLDEEEKLIKSRADAYSKLLQAEESRLAEDGANCISLTIGFEIDCLVVRTDINAVIGEVNLLLRGKLKQFRGLCQANVVRPGVMTIVLTSAV